MPMGWLHMRSATELAALIRRREVSPVDVVSAHIARIEEVNRALNALVDERFERALAEARAAEARVMAAPAPDALPPLLGVPCTIKEFLAVEGMSHTAGLLSRRHVRAERDATVVRRLREAGAIVLGLSNVPEGGMWMETYNKIYGRTNNPWDLGRTPGGSSGGEAALIAAGASPFGLGSDIGGSIRLPAAFCGVAGHKPTGRMVPNTDHWAAHPGMGGVLCTGPMARRVGDLALLLDIIAGPDGVDPCTRPWPRGAPGPGLANDGAGDLAGVVVYPLEEVGALRVSQSMRQQVRRATDSLRARGATVAALHAPLLSSLPAIWGAAMNELSLRGGGPSFAEVLGNGKRLGIGAEAARMALRRGRLTGPALGLMVLERLMAMVPARALARVPRAEALRDQLEAALGPRGVIVLPPYTRPAPVHGRPLLRPFDFLCTALCNITELPATQVSTGFDEGGLPVGVQVAARRGNDALTLAVAAAIEDALSPSWAPAPVLG